MANQAKRGGEPLQIQGGDLGDLAFEWTGDRYTHRWSFGSQSLVGLASNESDSSAAWPQSPPLQQIHQQKFGDGRDVVFGVGMAGRGHWSASFTLVRDLKCWIIELACRASVQPERLQSCYRALGTWNQNSSGVLTCPLQDGQLQLEAVSPSSIAELQQKSLCVRPNSIGPGAATTQWTFRLRVNKD